MIRVSRRTFALLFIAAPLFACAEELDMPWTRVTDEFDPDFGHYYSIVQADRDAGTCVALGLRTPSEYPSESDDRVEVRGADLEFDGGYGTEYSPDCTNEYHINAYAKITGSVEFHRYVSAPAVPSGKQPCAVDFDVRVVMDAGPTYTLRGEDAPIHADGCPRPAAYAAEYVELDAAYGTYAETEQLILAAWDPERETCVWARFYADANPASEVATPSGWSYGGLGFGQTAVEGCVAAELVTPPTGTSYPRVTFPALGSSGTLSFAEVDAEGRPCRVDVDVVLESFGPFDWVLDDVGLRASGVAVAGGCG